jgi:hypothetical protein
MPGHSSVLFGFSAPSELRAQLQQVMSALFGTLIHACPGHPQLAYNIPVHMRDIGLPELLAMLVVAILLFGGGSLGPALRDLFRGGPRPPSHPLLGNDSRFLTRTRSIKVE